MSDIVSQEDHKILQISLENMVKLHTFVFQKDINI